MSDILDKTWREKEEKKEKKENEEVHNKLTLGVEELQANGVSETQVIIKLLTTIAAESIVTNKVLKDIYDEIYYN